MDTRRARLLTGAMLGAFLIMRGYLYFAPETDLRVAGYELHHLFSGLLIMALAGIPLTLLTLKGWKLDAAVAGFGFGLGLALDEWVYLVVTDGSNASYLLPISFWGGFCLILLACLYIFILHVLHRTR